MVTWGSNFGLLLFINTKRLAVFRSYRREQTDLIQFQYHVTCRSKMCSIIIIIIIVIFNFILMCATDTKKNKKNIY